MNTVIELDIAKSAFSRGTASTGRVSRCCVGGYERSEVRPGSLIASVKS